MKLITVDTPADWRLFFKVPHQIYRKDPNWIAPLEMELRQVFDPAENLAMRHGVARCFVLQGDKGELLGRIAAFVDQERNRTHVVSEGGIGFFECVDDINCAKTLFTAAEAYLWEQGVEVIDGPINFGQRDKFWGLLVKGFLPPLYQENYNPPYYEKFFTGQGYIPFEQILTYAGDSENIPFERLASVAKRLKERTPVSVEPLNYKSIDKFAQDFAEVYNASFAEFDHFHPIIPELVRNVLIQAKAIADPHIAAIAYYDQHPAGFVALYPDINPMLRHAKGKLNWMTIPVFLLKKRLTRTFTAKGMGFGIHPEFQAKGIFALLIDFLCSPRNRQRYPRMCLAGIRTHNHAIRSVYAKLEVEIERIHVAYRKALKPGVEIKPFEFIDQDQLR